MRGQEIMAVAVIRPNEGEEEECLAMMKRLYEVLRRKNYSRDVLYRDPGDGRWINVRYWKSEEAREQAHEDPEVHRLWQRLGQLCTVEKVRERVEEVDIRSAAAGHE